MAEGADAVRVLATGNEAILAFSWLVSLLVWGSSSRWCRMRWTGLSA
ncbi:hypothetical protein SAMN05442782_11037 [Streptomyces sp. OK228]|nr:hypothetical protein SAMN05442782_11037 [Streptomyces sp. OK228]